MVERPLTTHKEVDIFDWLAALAVFAGSLSLYVRTLAPGLLLGDSGEYQALAYTLGLGHSTGYPIYILIAKLATFIPVSDVAYRVNLLSAIFASLALAFLYLIARLVGAGRIAALAGPAALAICHVFWWHAVIAEVYTASAAFLGAVLLLVLLWKNSGKAGFLFAAGFLGGISLGIHNTVALAAPGVVVFLLLMRCDRRGWSRAVIGVVVGFIVFLGAFFSMDALNTEASFTNVVRPSSDLWGYSREDFNQPLKRFEYLFFAQQWRGRMFSSSFPQVVIHAAAYFGKFLQWFRAPFVLLTAAGFMGFFMHPRKKKQLWREGLFLFTTWLVLFAFIINYDIGDIQTFYIPSYLPLMAAAGFGLTSVIEVLLWAGRGIVAGRSRSAVGGALALILLLGVFWPVHSLVNQSWKAQRITFLDRTEDGQYPYPVANPEGPSVTARRVVAQVEGNAILFTGWDILYPTVYVANVEMGKPQLSVHEMYPMVVGGSRFSALALEVVRENFGKRPIYFTEVDDLLLQNYRLLRIDTQTPLYRLESK